MERVSFILLFSLFALSSFANAASSGTTIDESIPGSGTTSNCCDHDDAGGSENGCAHFKNHDELRVAVTQYLSDGCSDNKHCQTSVVKKHGWPIGAWCVARVTRMDSVFQHSRSFNDDISSWDVSSVTDMGSMFDGASAFNQDLASWDVSSVRNMQFMFQEASSFDGDISSWNTSQVTNSEAMFSDALSFNQDLSSWDVSSMTNMRDMFSSASAFNQDLCTWGNKLPGLVKTDDMFMRSGCLSSDNPVLQGNGPFCALACSGGGEYTGADESADFDAGDKDGDESFVEDEDADGDSHITGEDEIKSTPILEATIDPTTPNSTEAEMEDISVNVTQKWDNATQGIGDVGHHYVHWEDLTKMLNPSGTGEEKCFTEPCDCADPTKALAKAGVFADQWKRHHDDMVAIANHSDARLDVVLLGDSIIERFGGTTGMGVEIVEGHKAAFDRLFSKDEGGWIEGKAFGTAQDVGPNLLWHIQNGLIDNLKPKVWFIMIGSNDLFTSKCKEDFVVASILNVVKLISEKSPDSRFVIHGILPRLDNPKAETMDLGEIWTRAQKVNSNLRKFCGKYDHLYYIYGGDLMLVRSSVTGFLDIDPKMIGDGVHPTLEGYENWGDFVADQLQQVLKDGGEDTANEDSNESEVPDVVSRDENESGSGDEDSDESETDESEDADAASTDQNESSGDEDSNDSETDESENANASSTGDNDSGEDEDRDDFEVEESKGADADTTDENESSVDGDNNESDIDESEGADADTTADENKDSGDEDSYETDVVDTGTTDVKASNEDEYSNKSEVVDANANESSDDEDIDGFETTDAYSTDESSEVEHSDNSVGGGSDFTDVDNAEIISEGEDGDPNAATGSSKTGIPEGSEGKKDEIEDVIDDGTTILVFGAATVVVLLSVGVLLLVCVCRKCCCRRSDNRGQYQQVTNQNSDTKRYKDASDDEDNDDGDIV